MEAHRDGNGSCLVRDVKGFAALIRHGADQLCAFRVGRFPQKDLRSDGGVLGGVRVEGAGAHNGSTALVMGLDALCQLVGRDIVSGEVQLDVIADDDLVDVLIRHNIRLP